MRISVTLLARAGFVLALTTGAELTLTHPAHAQSDPSLTAPASLADLRRSVPETRTGRYAVISGERAFVRGYRR